MKLAHSHQGHQDCRRPVMDAMPHPVREGNKLLVVSGRWGHEVEGAQALELDSRSNPSRVPLVLSWLSCFTCPRHCLLTREMGTAGLQQNWEVMNVKHLVTYHVTTQTWGLLLLKRVLYRPHWLSCTCQKGFWNKWKIHFFSAHRKGHPEVGYLFGHALSLTPKPPATRFLWHFVFHPGLDCSLKTSSVSLANLSVTKYPTTFYHQPAGPCLTMESEQHTT